MEKHQPAVVIEKIEYHYHNHVDTSEILSLLNILKTQNHNIMATIQELSAKVDELQTALDTEQQQIADAIAALQATVTDLQGQLTAGGTEAERQAVLDKLNSVITDLQGTIA